MRAIEIILFALGTFFGLHNPVIVSEKVTITIDPTEHRVEIRQYRLQGMFRDSIDLKKLDAEWEYLNNDRERMWADEIAEASEKDFNFYVEPLDSVQGNGLNALITFRYPNERLLETFGIDAMEGHFSLINIPNWNISSSDGVLKQNHWNFPKDRPFTFSMGPFLNQRKNRKKIALYQRYSKVLEK